MKQNITLSVSVDVLTLIVCQVLLPRKLPLAYLILVTNHRECFMGT